MDRQMERSTAGIPFLPVQPPPHAVLASAGSYVSLSPPHASVCHNGPYVEAPLLPPTPPLVGDYDLCVTLCNAIETGFAANASR